MLTRHRDDLRLFINGNIQFSSKDEYRYHEALVHLAMTKAAKRENVLILGGGDGLAAREILKYDEVQKITLVDLDKEIIRICQENELIANLNDHSLSNAKMNVVVDDAYKFLVENQFKYDVIIVDLPDPNNEALNKLYTNVFYRLCKQAMTNLGVMVVQSTSPYFATEAFWCIHQTIASEGFHVLPYHLEVPSFGDWGFNLATFQEVDTQFKFNVSTKFLTEEKCQTIFSFAKDEKPNQELKINTLSNPILMKYYGDADKKWR